MYFFLAIALLSPLIQAQIPSRCLQPVSSGFGYLGSIRYAYDKNTGRCGYFTYLGNGGNNNRFNTLQECRQVCEQSAQQPPSEVPDIMPAFCSLPPDSGPCGSYSIKYTFDIFTQKCIPFYYGGCGGNENRFNTKAQCETTCLAPIMTAPAPPEVDVALADVCRDKPSDTGPCMAAIQQYTYDHATQQCIPFIYGGCGGSKNRFPTKEECEMVCKPLGRTAALRSQRFAATGEVFDPCSLEVDPGPCKAFTVKYAFNPKRNQCEEFFYGGCQGNANRFNTLEECEQSCNPELSAAVEPSLPDRCRQPQDPGNCMAYIPQYSFDATTGKCVQFVYGGCGGNENRFETLAECEATCSADGNLQGPGPSPDPSVPPQCTLPHDRGNCMASLTQYAYDVKAGKCVQFIYGGCGGNANRFETLAECQAVCEGGNQLGSSGSSDDVPARCQKPLDTGPCFAMLQKYGYDTTRGKCVKFTYGGCQGNDNRFDTMAECEQVCEGGEPPLSSPSLPDRCRQPQDPGNCAAYIPQYSFDATTGKCVQFVYGGCGGNENRFETLAECETTCSGEGNLQGSGESPDRPIPPRCTEPAPSGLCSGFYTKRYTFDQNTQECRPFFYGGCDVTNNHFETKRECEVVCKEGVSPRDA